VLGLLVGIGSVCFVKLLLYIRRRFMALPKSTLWLQPTVGGLTVGLLGWFMPEVLGVGYDYVERVLMGDLALRTVAILAVLKIVATATCYGTGNAGGIFGPSLFIGATIGGAVGSIAHTLAPGITAGPGAYALVGMGAAFAGIIRTPITSVIMIFEMTRDYSIIVPLMISNLIGYFISQRLQRQPIYDALAHQEGVHLPSGELREQLSRLQVHSALRPDDQPLAPDVDFQTAAEFLRQKNLNAWPVARDGRLWGLLTTQLLNEGKKTSATVIGDFFKSDEPIVHVHLDHPLSIALDRMGSTHVEALPVVSRAEIRKLLGIVTLPEVLKAYGLQPLRHTPE
jgi:CIC family chloride channel protein